MNRSKRRAFERMAAKYPDTITRKVYTAGAPGIRALHGSRLATGLWGLYLTTQIWQWRKPDGVPVIRIEDMRIGAHIELPEVEAEAGGDWCIANKRADGTISVAKAATALVECRTGYDFQAFHTLCGAIRSYAESVDAVRIRTASVAVIPLWDGKIGLCWAGALERASGALVTPPLGGVFVSETGEPEITEYERTDMEVFASKPGITFAEVCVFIDGREMPYIKFTDDCIVIDGADSGFGDAANTKLSRMQESCHPLIQIGSPSLAKPGNVE